MKIKARKLLEALYPETKKSVDFTDFDEKVSQLKLTLTEKIQTQTLQDVDRQLEKFKKKLNLLPLVESLEQVKVEVDKKVKAIAELINQEVTTFRRLLDQNDSSGKISVIASNIDVLKKELVILNESRLNDIGQLKDKLDKFQEFVRQANESIDLLKDRKEENVIELIEKLRREFNNRLGNLSHGGNANRNIAVGGNPSVLSRYTDINIKAGSNVTLTYANNNTTKYLDLTIAATGSGGGITREINTISIDTNAGSTAGIDYVYLADDTLTLTLPTAASNENLYTVKNIGTGTVTIATTGGETIDDESNLIMVTQYTSVDLISDGSNWKIT